MDPQNLLKSKNGLRMLQNKLELIRTNDIEEANVLALVKMFSKSKEVAVSQNFVPLQIVIPKKEMIIYHKTSQKVQQKYFFQIKRIFGLYFTN